VKIENMRTLDLHGVSHEDAYLKCHKFINANYGHDMFIITGHSDKMKKIVSEVAEKYRLQYLVGGVTGTHGVVRIFGGNTNE
jgi:hypothetical protein